MAILTGVWQRKEMQFADQQAVEAAKVVIDKHPYTIATMPDFASEYARIFGLDELEALKNSLKGGKYNMVVSFTKEWVVGGVWVPPAPKASEVLKPGYAWQDTPFGRRQVPQGQATIQPAAAVAELTADIKQELAAIVYENVTAALKAWSQAS